MVSPVRNSGWSSRMFGWSMERMMAPLLYFIVYSPDQAAGLIPLMASGCAGGHVWSPASLQPCEFTTDAAPGSSAADASVAPAAVPCPVIGNLGSRGNVVFRQHVRPRGRIILRTRSSGAGSGFRACGPPVSVSRAAVRPQQVQSAADDEDRQQPAAARTPGQQGDAAADGRGDE